jgi:23S rRNA (pseudouridine1915-N3)-methyltransferase
MRCHLICCGQRMPTWVAQGFQEFHKRLPKHLAPTLIELPTVKASSHETICQQEGALLLKAIPPESLVIALDDQGTQLNTKQFSAQLNTWCQQTKNLCFVIGGPYGLSQTLLDRADFCWSLSALTFPHQVVRLIIIEQLYRAHCLLTHHPYHHD